jgi:hypothetical protein
MKPPLHPSISVRVFESVETGSLELRVFCQSCWQAGSGFRSLDDVERFYLDHKCSVSGRGGRE